MSINTLEDFKRYALRQLGEPILSIEVTDEQLQDQYEYAIKKFNDYHFNGTEKIYLRHQITSQDVTNQYIPVDPSITGIIKVFNFSNAGLSQASPFNVEYQLRLNDLWDLGSSSLVYYVQSREYINMLDLILNGYPLFRFNRVLDRLYIDTTWGVKLKEGDYVMAECYRAIDPEEFVKAFNDNWFKDYFTARVKYQWGNNLKKYDGVQLIGGVTVNGQQIYEEAREEIAELEQSLDTKYQEPPMFFIG
jgi:hypothetical protein